jgi:hypothetical protein
MAARRARGQGQLYIRNGTYYGRWRTIDGRRLNRRIGLVRADGQADGLTKAAAERAFRKLQDVEDHRPPPIAPEVRRTVDDAANELRRQLLLEPLEKVTRRDVEDVEAVMLAKGRKPKTVRNVMKFLHGVFEFAIDEEWCRENPARSYNRRRKRRTRDSSPRTSQPPVGTGHIHQIRRPRPFSRSASDSPRRRRARRSRGCSAR